MLLWEMITVDLLVVSVSALVAFLDVRGRTLLLVDGLVDCVVEGLTLKQKSYSNLVLIFTRCAIAVRDRLSIKGSSNYL